MHAHMDALCTHKHTHTEHRWGCLQNEFQSLQAHKDQLLSAMTQLEGELASLRGETEGLQGELETGSVELKKTRAHSHTLEKRNKVTKQGREGGGREGTQ